MDQFVIDGGRPLRGAVRASGSKNAALPILFATLLTDETCRVSNVPRLRDIRTTVRVLESLGKKISWSGHAITVSGGARLMTAAPYDLVKQMRASVLAAGPLLARFGHVRVPLPGGCAIGLRPIDIHLKAFRDLGAKQETRHGDILLSGRLRPGTVRFKFASVGATENVMIAAAALEGETTLLNAAKEPEIADLAAFLEKLGARVRGAGTSTVRVRGARRLRGARHAVIPDRVETGTFLIACAAAGGRLEILGARGEDLRAVIAALRRAGSAVRETSRGLSIVSPARPRPVSIVTAPHPGFPTDLQAPWLALMCVARGKSAVRETVFENRFLHAAELARMGARIAVRGRTAVIEGLPALLGAPIMASDIRAGAGLVVAALAARGRTTIQRVYHIDRGYERLEAKLRAAGARARRVGA